MSSSLTTIIPTIGLTEVFSHPDPHVDIVFVHGLNGNPKNTWTGADGTFWPRDLLPNHVGDVRIRVLTHGYDSRVSAFVDGVGKDHIHHHAENLAAKLYSDRSVNKAIERPIIFIVHSLGGLVAKQCLIYSRSIDHPNSEHLRSIFVSTYGMLFMGTPHLGSDLAKWGTLLQSIASAALPKRFFDSSPNLVEALKTNNETLQNINRLFNEIMPRLRIYFFYEGKPMDLKGTRQFVVDEDSAAPNYPGAERMGIEQDHSHMCKFEDKKSNGFSVVAEAVERYSKDAPGVVAVRWERERQVRAFEREMSALELKTGALRGSSRGTSPDSRQTISRDAATPSLLPSHPRTPPNLLENGNASTYQPYEIEEHEADTSRQPSLAPPLADATNQSPPKSPNTSTLSASIPRLVHPMLVAPLGFRPNTHFVGFDIEMARLTKKLADEKRATIGAKSALLYGPPGCGKSHLAREYLWRHFEEYPHGIFWIDCKTPESMNKGFWNVATSTGCVNEAQFERPDAFIDSVRRHLAALDKWLMVFDGLSFENERELEAFKRYIPDGKGSSIIFTTVNKTLANRQRLLNPPGIKVYPVSVDQGCALLFKSLHMKETKPRTEVQKRKARQLVKYYECLPLGIHAAAHMLLARGRALEKYSPGPSNNRLAAPFLDILATLDKTQQTEAVSLLMIMCFLNHEVPVVMLQFGHHALLDAGVEIRSLDPNGGSARRELDNSIATLLRNGLIERRLQPHPANPGVARSSSPEEGRSSQPERKASEPTFDTHDHDDTESQKSSATFVGIDVIRVHTVVQQVFLDHLKAYSPDRFNWWLTVSAKFVMASWNLAHERIRSNAGRGLVSDYREFESHAERVWSHFPSRPEGNPPQYLRQARHDLHNVRRDIKREIDNQSPSQSSNTSIRAGFVSVFERSGSSSDEGPATPTSGLTRMSTWSVEPAIDSTESPVEYQQQTYIDLPPRLDDSWHEDDGYTSDMEHRPGPKERTVSTSTERTYDERQSALRAIFEGRTRADTDAWRPVPVVGTVPTHGFDHSRTQSASSHIPIRPSSASSLAEQALSAVHSRSPPATRAPTVIPSQMSTQQPRTERRPLSELPTNNHLPYSRRTSSSSPHLVQAVMANTMQRDQLPTEENISTTRRSQPMSILGGKSWKPSLPTLESHSLPAGYGPLAMMRDPSHESTFSTQTEPAENAGSSSTNDEYLTPIMSPVEGPSAGYLNQSRRGRGRPQAINTAGSGTAPYPMLDAPDTEPLPLVSPVSAIQGGLGIQNIDENATEFQK